MPSLIREVLLPSAAAVVLLFVAAVDVAIAADASGVEPVQIAAAQVASARHQPAPTKPTASADSSRPSTKPLEVVRRCARTERIGKFSITKCD